MPFAGTISIHRSSFFRLGSATWKGRTPQATILSRIACQTAARPSAASPHSISDRSPSAPKRAGGLANTWSIQEELHAERFRDGLWHRFAAASGMAGLAKWTPSKSRASAYLRQRLHRFKCAVLYCEPSVDPLEMICRNPVVCGGMFQSPVRATAP